MSKDRQHSNPESQKQHWNSERDAALVKSDGTGSIRKWLRLADQMFHNNDDDPSPSAA